MLTASKKIETKPKILDNAFYLFRDSSVSATAIDDIVKAAGIARGTFYLYFKDKSDLLEQIILYKSTEYMREILRETFSAEKSGEFDFFDLVRRFLNSFIDFLIKNREILPVMSKNISSCIKNLPDFYDAEISSIYERLIGHMIDMGYDAESAHMTAFIVIDMTGSVCADAILHSKPFPIEHVRNIVVESAVTLIKNNANLMRGDSSETRE